MTIEWLEISMQILLRSFTVATSSLETNQNNIWNVIESIFRFGRIGVDVVTAEQIGVANNQVRVRVRSEPDNTQTLHHINPHTDRPKG